MKCDFCHKEIDIEERFVIYSISLFCSDECEIKYRKGVFTMIFGSSFCETYPIIMIRNYGSDESVHFNINNLDKAKIDHTPFICRDIPHDNIKKYAEIFTKWAKEIEELEKENVKTD